MCRRPPRSARTAPLFPRTTLFRAAESTPASARALARRFEAAGCPPGVGNVVPGDGPDAGARRVAHPDVAKISFTGEGATAKTILKTGADTLTRCTFELGGKEIGRASCRERVCQYV